METLSTFCDLCSRCIAQQLAGNDANVDKVCSPDKPETAANDLAIKLSK